ncbi:MAG: hypothetical protein R2771_07310 [Saprospiraceae bacterium]
MKNTKAKYLLRILTLSVLFLLILFSNNKIYSQCNPVSGKISGSVIDDVNLNDTEDIADLGLSNVKVVAYDNHQQVASESVTDANGAFTLMDYWMIINTG